MNNLKDLTVIIVTFKTNEEILFNCLDSIKKEVKILIVENSNDLEFKNLLLTENLDVDYIETLIREKFLYGKKGETLYIIKNNDN